MEKPRTEAAKNVLKLLDYCWEKGLSQKQILKITEPIGKEETIAQKEHMAQRIYNEMIQNSREGGSVVGKD